MGKEDKQFFIGLFKGLEGRFDGLEEQVGRNYEAIQKNSRLIQKNSDGIRCLGVEFEDLKSNFTAFGERQDVMDNRLQRVENNVKGIKKTVSDYPELRSVVKSHSRMLAALSR